MAINGLSVQQLLSRNQRRKNTKLRRLAPNQNRIPMPSRLARTSTTLPRPPGLGRRARAPRVGRQVDLFNPLNPALIRTVVSDGKAYPVDDMARSSTQINPTFRRAVIVSNTGHSGTLGVTWTNVPANAAYTVPTLNQGAPTGFGPTSGRAMKASLTLQNYTKTLDVAGRVYVLNAQQRFDLPALPSAMTIAQIDTFFDEVIAHPQCRTHSGHDFLHPKVLCSHPVDSTDYHNFSSWVGTDTFDQFMAHVADWTGGIPSPRPMSTIIVIFESTAVANDYSLSLRGSWYTRWPLTTIPGRGMTPIPTGTQSAINSARAVAEGSANIIKDAVEAVGGAAVGAGAYAAAMNRMAAPWLAEAGELALPLLAL